MGQTLGDLDLDLGFDLDYYFYYFFCDFLPLEGFFYYLGLVFPILFYKILLKINFKFFFTNKLKFLNFLDVHCALVVHFILKKNIFNEKTFGIVFLILLFFRLIFLSQIFLFIILMALCLLKIYLFINIFLIFVLNMLIILILILFRLILVMLILYNLLLFLFLVII